MMMMIIIERYGPEVWYYGGCLILPQIYSTTHTHSLDSPFLSPADNYFTLERTKEYLYLVQEAY